MLSKTYKNACVAGMCCWGGPASVAEEADGALRVTADHGDDDGLLLAPLEAVDAAHLHRRQRLSPQLPQQRDLSGSR